MKKSFFPAIYFVVFCMGGLFAGCDRDGPGGPTTTTTISYYTTTTTSIRYYTTTTTSIQYYTTTTTSIRATTTTTITTAAGLTVTQSEATPADNTKVLDNYALLYEITDFSDDGRIAFDAGSEAANLLEAGDIIAAGVSSATPYGMLRKVVSRSQYGGEIIVTTEQATLEEAFDELSLDFTHTMSQSNTSNFVALKRGLSLAKRPNSSASLFGFEVNLDDLEIYDYDGNPYTTNDRVAADGSFKFSVDYKVSVDIDYWYGLQQLEFRTDIDESSELDVAWNYALQQAVEQEVAKWTASPVTIMAGVVPLVFVPELVLNIGASASVDASLSTGYKQTFDYWTSLTWENTWSKTQGVNKLFDYYTPSLDASISAEAYLEPELDILLYGLAGPKASTKGYLSFDADIDECPWWSLDLGIDVLVGIAPGVFSDDIEYNLPAFQLVAPYEIASADSCFQGGGGTTTTSASVSDDHGDSCSSATNITYNDTVSGSIETEGDEDFFRMYVPSTGTLTIYTTGSTDTSGYLLGYSCSTIVFDEDDGADLNFQIVRSISSGTYYIKVEGHDSGVTGSYTLWVSFSFDTSSTTTSSAYSTTTSSAYTTTTTTDSTSCPEAGSSPFTAPTLPLNSFCSEYRDYEEWDYYEVNLTTSGTLTVYTISNIDTVGYVYDSDDRQVAYDDDGSEDSYGNFRISNSFLAGTYYIAVKGYYSNTEGPYTLYIEFE